MENRSAVKRGIVDWFVDTFIPLSDTEEDIEIAEDDWGVSMILQPQVNLSMLSLSQRVHYQLRVLDKVLYALEKDDLLDFNQTIHYAYEVDSRVAGMQTFLALPLHNRLYIDRILNAINNLPVQRGLDYATSFLHLCRELLLTGQLQSHEYVEEADASLHLIKGKKYDISPSQLTCIHDAILSVMNDESGVLQQLLRREHAYNEEVSARYTTPTTVSSPEEMSLEAFLEESEIDEVPVASASVEKNLERKNESIQEIQVAALRLLEACEDKIKRRGEQHWGSWTLRQLTMSATHGGRLNQLNEIRSLVKEMSSASQLITDLKAKLKDYKPTMTKNSTLFLTICDLIKLCESQHDLAIRLDRYRQSHQRNCAT